MVLAPPLLRPGPLQHQPGPSPGCPACPPPPDPLARADLPRPLGCLGPVRHLDHPGSGRTPECHGPQPCPQGVQACGQPAHPGLQTPSVSCRPQPGLVTDAHPSVYVSCLSCVQVPLTLGQGPPPEPRLGSQSLKIPGGNGVRGVSSGAPRGRGVQEGAWLSSATSASAVPHFPHLLDGNDSNEHTQRPEAGGAEGQRPAPSTATGPPTPPQPLARGSWGRRTPAPGRALALGEPSWGILRQA